MSNIPFVSFKNLFEIHLQSVDVHPFSFVDAINGQNQPITQLKFYFNSYINEISLLFTTVIVDDSAEDSKYF
jgi:hypothetical protein